MNKTVLITGGARRVGAAICHFLHDKGYNIALHYYRSQQEAFSLADELNAKRINSVCPLQADLNNITQVEGLIDECLQKFQRIDCIINNASSFFATPIGATTIDHWQDLFNSNVMAPFFLCQKATPALATQRGCIINIIDIHASRPLKNYSIYCIAKAALAMLTKSLAKELGPHVRVNGIAPGAIMWPEQDNSLTAEEQEKIIDQTALKHIGSAQDIAKTAYFLLADAPYITGQIIAVDGGRSLGFY
jgi:pteridine reductase